MINKEVDIKYYDINYLSNINVLYIFLFNFIIVTIWFVFAHLGISIFFVFKFVIGMVMAGKEFYGGARIYFLSSLSHGVCELLIVFLIFSYSIDFLIALIDLYKTGDKTQVVSVIKKFFKEKFFIILLLLIISSILEVYVSNRIITFLFGG
ncbi:stage II sporulation protein M [Clostridium perfringens]|nr:stage II sporulation protein M [Clostridium perfringens]MBI6029663.1 stage II sporulation protein M [Clostridium perfringens]MBI6032984.1 stage II sporulation protein M [Clostridium perfringens]MBI6069482.1 stage II sporulation protein M [Clostridium perfringens]